MFDDADVKEVVKGFGLGDEIKADSESGTTRYRIILYILVVTIATFFFLYSKAAYVEDFVVNPFGLLPINMPLAFFLLFLFFYSYYFSMFIVPELRGHVTSNAFTGALHTYGPGFQVKYPWEHSKYQIDLVLTMFPVVGTFFTQDGIPVTYTAIVQFSPRLRLLPLYIQAGENQRNDAIGAVIRSS